MPKWNRRLRRHLKRDLGAQLVIEVDGEAVFPGRRAVRASLCSLGRGGCGDPGGELPRELPQAEDSGCPLLAHAKANPS